MGGASLEKMSVQLSLQGWLDPHPSMGRWHDAKPPPGLGSQAAGTQGGPLAQL